MWKLAAVIVCTLWLAASPAWGQAPCDIDLAQPFYNDLTPTPGCPVYAGMALTVFVTPVFDPFYLPEGFPMQSDPVVVAMYSPLTPSSPTDGPCDYVLNRTIATIPPITEDNTQNPEVHIFQQVVASVDHQVPHAFFKCARSWVCAHREPDQSTAECPKDGAEGYDANFESLTVLVTVGGFCQ